MIDEETYNTLKKYTEPQPHRDAWLSELGYIEATDLHVKNFKITAQGIYALREYEMYAERNRLEDDRYAKDNHRNVVFNTASLVFAIIAAVGTLASIILGLLHII